MDLLNHSEVTADQSSCLFCLSFVLLDVSLASVKLAVY